jgi:isopropylmalate/homocitrate/citramalate synthase
MSEQPWKQENWFVSPWNFVDEVRESLNFADNIKVHDITLRDGEQQTGIAFTKDDKIRIAEALAEAGVHRIEAGMPVVSPEDAAAVREIARRNLGPEIYAFSRCMVDDVQRAVDAGVSGLVMEIPSSDHIIQYAYQWQLEKAIDLSIESTRFAHEQGLKVVFFPIDFTRAEINWVLDLITRVAREGHMDSLVLVDTFGVTSPHAMRYFVRQVQSRIDKPLEAHFHMDFGMGVANTIMALAEGVEVIHSTVLGIGERAGNTPMEETVMALLTMYGIDLGLKYEKLTSLARLVEELSGQKVPTNKPVVGSSLFQVESGIIASWLKNCGDQYQTELFPYRPGVVGQSRPEIVMGKGSGIDSVKMWLHHLELEATEDEAMDVLMAVKQFGLKTKRLLSEQEFAELAEETIARSRAAAAPA